MSREGKTGTVLELSLEVRFALQGWLSQAYNSIHYCCCVTIMHASMQFDTLRKCDVGSHYVYW